MKKILHIPNYYPPHRGGIEDVCFNIVSELIPFFDQQIICFNDSNKTILFCITWANETWNQYKNRYKYLEIIKVVNRHITQE